MSKLLKDNLDGYNETEVKDLEQKITHIPALITLICRLFAREFETLYALIKEKINRNFSKWKEGDLCLYRMDLVDTLASPTSGVSSKPEQIV